MLSFAATVDSASVEAAFDSAGAGTTSAGILLGAASAAGVTGPVSVTLTTAGVPGAPGWLRDGSVDPVPVVLVPLVWLLVWVLWVPDVWVGTDVLALVVVEPVPAVLVVVVPAVWVGPDVLSPAVLVAGGALAGAVTGAGPEAGSVLLV